MFMWEDSGRYTFYSRHSKIFKFQKCWWKRQNIYKFLTSTEYSSFVSSYYSISPSPPVTLIFSSSSFFPSSHCLEKQQIEYLWFFIVHILLRTRKKMYSSSVLLHLLRYVRFHFYPHQPMQLLIFQSFCDLLRWKNFILIAALHCHEENKKTLTTFHKFHIIFNFQSPENFQADICGKLLKFILSTYQSALLLHKSIDNKINIDWMQEPKSETIDINGIETKSKNVKSERKRKNLSSGCFMIIFKQNNRKTQIKHIRQTLYDTRVPDPLCSIHSYTLSLAYFYFLFFLFQLAFTINLKNSFSGNILAIQVYSMQCVICSLQWKYQCAGTKHKVYISHCFIL